MKTNTLHTIKNTGFTVPKGYFDTLENEILCDIKLKSLATKSGHELPDAYFDTLENNIINTINSKKEVKVIKLVTWEKIASASLVAASVLLMFHLFFNTNKPITIDAIETASLEQYILNEDLDSNEFASLFTDEELSEIHLINDGFNSQTLENYLIDNLEIEDIITK